MSVLFMAYSRPIDVGFNIPNKFIVGCNMDYNEYFRELNVSYNKWSLVIWYLIFGLMFFWSKACLHYV